MEKTKNISYELETIANPVPVAETSKYLKEHVAEVVSVADVAKCDGDKAMEALLIAKYSDKKMKGKTKTIAKMDKKIDKTKRPRYYLPLVFTTPEKKSILRRLKIMDIRDDKRYDMGSESSNWMKAYGEMILCKIEQGETGLSIQRNPLFSLEIFRRCGGVLNARFWDLNLRYAEKMIDKLDA